MSIVNEVEFALFLQNTTFSNCIDAAVYTNIAEPQVALFPSNKQSLTFVWNLYPAFERKQSAPPITGAVLLMKLQPLTVAFKS